MNAADIPIAAISAPDLIQFPVVSFAFVAPKANRTKTEIPKVVGIAATGDKKKNGISGNRDPISEATPTIIPDLKGLWLSLERPSSSDIIVWIQSFFDDVNFLTIDSSLLPRKPFLK